MNDNRGKFLALLALPLLGVYVVAYYLLPPRWGGLYPLTPYTWSSACYNTVFYPLRRLTRTEIHEWDGWVEWVDPKKRIVLVMNSREYGNLLPYRLRDEAAIRELQRFDRIRVRVAYLPQVQVNSIYWEFRGYFRLPGEEDGD